MKRARSQQGYMSLAAPADGLIIVPTKVIDQSNVEEFEADLKAKIASASS